MFIKIFVLTFFQTVLLILVSSSTGFAADPSQVHTYPWPWWYATPWSQLWWIFPLLIFVFMVVMMILMMRRGGWGCMWCNRWINRSESGDIMKRSLNEPFETALDILNKRYAKGEIDREEYEEKKAAITNTE